MSALFGRRLYCCMLKKGLILQGLSEPFVLKMKLGQETLLIREYVPNVQEIAKTLYHYDRPIRIREMASMLPEVAELTQKPDLSIDFCGVHCENPFFLSSSIVAGDYEMCAKALDMGWAGVVYKTVGFLIPEEVSPRFDAIGKEGTPFIGFKNLEQISDHELSYNLDVFRKLKKNYPDKVLVVSIMGQNDEEWVKLSQLVTEAGADIIECNFSCPHMSGEGLGSDVGQNPELVKHYTQLVKSATHLPVLAKMTPNIGNMEIPANCSRRRGSRRNCRYQYN